ncbi:MAG: hypothetical protein J07HN4v3_00355 [Halonotius sp. J07HN4]|nr:MAG: hypothetical protein J07HN4v3_00355 [Halonotius sp. J07HN4]
MTDTNVLYAELFDLDERGLREQEVSESAAADQSCADTGVVGAEDATKSVEESAGSGGSRRRRVADRSDRVDTTGVL